MKQPHQKLPKNNLAKEQHQRAGAIAANLMGTPRSHQKESDRNPQKRLYGT